MARWRSAGRCGLGQRRLGLVEAQPARRNRHGPPRARSDSCRPPFVLVGGLGVARAFEQQVGQQQPRGRRLRRRVEAVEVLAVPAHGCVAIGVTALLLRERVVMLRQVEQVRLHGSADARIDVGPALRPVGAARAVEFDQFLLRFEHQRGEPGLAISLGRLAEQDRRLGVPRLPARERPIDFGAVLESLLLDVQVAQRAIQTRLVGCRAALRQRRLQRGRAFVRGEHQAQRAQGVVGQLLLRTRQLRGVAQLAVLHQQRVEQGEEIAAARRVVAQLELCPAALVQRLLVERARRAHGEHRARTPAPASA